jgi:hypothetical protein
MGVVNTGYTFQDTDVITSARMNNIIDETEFTDDAIVFGNLSLEQVGGKLKVKSSGIGSDELAIGAVTNTKILDDAVTTSKILDDAVTTSKILDDAVTTAKILDDNVTTDKIENGAITAGKLDGAQAGTAPIFGARAYGAFNGTATSPIAPINAGNITSITRTGTGNYTVVMSTAMTDANYCVVANEFLDTAGGSAGTSCSISIINSSSFSMLTLNQGGGPYNSQRIDFVVFK